VEELSYEICNLGRTIKWKNFPMKYATWEGPEILDNPDLHYLRRSNFQERGLVMSLS
jgi:hypothetical protein